MCGSRGGRPGLPVHNKPYGFCGRKAPWKKDARQRNFGSIPLRLSFLFKSHGLLTLSCDFVSHNWWNIKMALIAEHLNAGVNQMVSVALRTVSLFPRLLWKLSCDFAPHNWWHIKMALVAAHLNAMVNQMVSAALGTVSLFPRLLGSRSPPLPLRRQRTRR